LPTYEYHCSTCNTNYELRQGFDAEITHPCEECGKGVAKRVLVAPRVVFKGSGWYATDSRGKRSATADSEPVTSPATADSTDSKPASKKTDAPATAAPQTPSSTTSAEAAS